MKLGTINVSILFIMFLLVGGTCEKKIELPDSVEELQLEKSSVELEEGRSTTVKITSGNGGYKTTTSPEEIVTTLVDEEKEISLTALKKGTTTITVIDAKEKVATIAATVKEKTPTVDPKDADGKFALAIYPDTQTEMQLNGNHVKQQAIDRSKWVVGQRDALDIRAVLHIGDVVNWDTAPYKTVWDPKDDHHQYEGAVLMLQPLRDVKMPTSLSIGNHDTMATGPTGGSNRGSYEQLPPGIDTYQLQRMTDAFNYYLYDSKLIPTWKPFETGKVDNGYWTFEAAGAKWLVLNLELWPRTVVTNWAKGIIEANPDRNIIIQTHNMFNGNCGIAGGDTEKYGGYGDNSPRRVWNLLVEPYSNVKVVTSGHEGVQCAQVFDTKKGHKVIGTLQNNVNKDYNPVRILEIDVKNGKATTYNYATNGNQTKDKVELTGLIFIKP